MLWGISMDAVHAMLTCTSTSTGTSTRTTGFFLSELPRSWGTHTTSGLLRFQVVLIGHARDIGGALAPTFGGHWVGIGGHWQALAQTSAHTYGAAHVCGMHSKKPTFICKNACWDPPCVSSGATRSACKKVRNSGGLKPLYYQL